MRLAVGTTLGPYVIGDLLGAGGMGEVYQARDPRLERDVAIKVLGGVDAAARDADRAMRFEREIRATAALSHPSIVTVYDVGTHEGAPFLVTELLHGRTLRERLKAERAIPAMECVGLASQLVAGLTAAHALRIVHRDIKPENLFLCLDGSLKILDFGLAKLRSLPFADAADPDAATLADSSPGRVSGTLSYMAPEQLRGEPVDGRVDVFAAGCVLHEMLLGTHPFLRKSGAETVAAILDRGPLRVDGPEVPAALRRFLLRCLEKDASERFQSAAELGSALEALRCELHSPSPASVESSGDPPLASIAVLPFVDMSPTRDQDYLCEGIAEEVLNALSHVAGLRVAARGSSFQFRGSGADVSAIGARLGVAHVLEGSVRKIGERLRVIVQLVDVAGGYQRWSERYDRQFEDVFAIQDDVAERVATALRGVLSPKEKQALRSPETAVEAYEYFLRGRRLTHRFTRVDLEVARRMFERAVELDPDYAPAVAGLADIHSWFYEWWGGGAESLDAADRCSRRAMELAPDTDEAHTSRGFVLALRRRYDEAGQAFAEAIRLNPKSYEAHYLHARSSFAAGDIERSVELFRRASELREEDFQSLILLGQSLKMLGRATVARQATHDGIRRAERQLELDPSDGRALSLGANALMDNGQKDRALSWSRRALEQHPEDQAVLINAACLRAKLGLKEEAFALLDRTFSRGWGKRDWIEHDPDYDSLRDDPRFQALLDKLS